MRLVDGGVKLMTEHEKLLAGMEYDYTDPEIQDMLRSMRDLRQAFNTEGSPVKRAELLREMLNSCGENVTVQQPVSILYGKHTSVGNDVFINGGCTLQDGARITIGDRVVIAPDVKLYCGEHAVDATQRWKRDANGTLKLVTTTRPISIGSDVWIGGGVTVLPGVTIGSNVVVGAGAVVTHDVPDNCIAAGVPARVIRELPAIPDVRSGCREQ